MRDSLKSCVYMHREYVPEHRYGSYILLVVEGGDTMHRGELRCQQGHKGEGGTLCSSFHSYVPMPLRRTSRSA